MNFCGECGKDLRVAHPQRFCELCGREFLGPEGLRTGPTAVAERVGTKAEVYTGLRKLVLELGHRYSFTSSPASVANNYSTPPEEVEEDSEFDTFDGGSVDSKLTYVLFGHPTSELPGLMLTYKFVAKEYSFYGSGDVDVFGLESIFLRPGEPLTRTGLHEVFGTPTDSKLLNNFDRADTWQLPTPTGGKKGREEFVAYYKAVSPDEVSSCWMGFPEV